MLKFIGKALAGLVLTREAREAANQLAVAKGLLPKPPPEDADEAAADGFWSVPAPLPTPLSPSVDPAKVVTTDRAELIRQAMQVRAAKQVILADLDDETRAKLVALAMKAL